MNYTQLNINNYTEFAQYHNYTMDNSPWSKAEKWQIMAPTKCLLHVYENLLYGTLLPLLGVAHPARCVPSDLHPRSEERLPLHHYCLL